MRIPKIRTVIGISKTRILDVNNWGTMFYEPVGMRIVNNSDPNLFLKEVSEDQDKKSPVYLQWDQFDLNLASM